jgi:hypothetical protein
MLSTAVPMNSARALALRVSSGGEEIDRQTGTQTGNQTERQAARKTDRLGV